MNIGEFQHVNFPINSGGAISGVGLRFTTDVWADGSFLGTKTFEYNFSHNETTNQSNPCANGQANGGGVSGHGRIPWLKQAIQARRSRRGHPQALPSADERGNRGNGPFH